MPNNDFSYFFVSKLGGMKTLMYASNAMKIGLKIEILCYFYVNKISQYLIKIAVEIRETEHK